MTPAQFIAEHATFVALALGFGLVLLFLLARRLAAGLRARRKAEETEETAEEIYRNFQRGRVQFFLTFLATVALLVVAVLSSMR